MSVNRVARALSGRPAKQCAGLALRYPVRQPEGGGSDAVVLPKLINKNPGRKPGLVQTESGVIREVAPGGHKVHIPMEQFSGTE